MVSRKKSRRWAKCTPTSQALQLRQHRTVPCALRVWAVPEYSVVIMGQRPNAYVTITASGRILVIVASHLPARPCTICITHRLEVMPELVSFAEAVWEMYITSFYPCLVFVVLNSIRTAGSTNPFLSSAFVRISPRCCVLHIQLMN